MEKIKVVQLAEIPCANSGYYLSKLINQYSDKYESRYVLGEQYWKDRPNEIPWRQFPIDLDWKTQQKECEQLIKEANIIHVHHNFYMNNPMVKRLLQDRKSIVTIYDLSLAGNNIYINNLKQLFRVLSVADQPAQRLKFERVNNIFVPLVNTLFNEDIKKENYNPLVVYAPTNRFPISNPSTKGYHEVLKVINELKNEGLSFEFDLVEGVSHEEDLNRKRPADIIIDDIVNNTWHNTSLQAACFGAISLTGHSSKEYPFIETNLGSLKNNLKFFINNPDALKKEQAKIVEWRKTCYTPEILINKIEDIYKLVR